MWRPKGEGEEKGHMTPMKSHSQRGAWKKGRNLGLTRSGKENANA